MRANLSGLDWPLMLCTTQEFPGQLRDYPCVQHLHGPLPSAHCIYVTSLRKPRTSNQNQKDANLQIFISCNSFRLTVLVLPYFISPFIDYFLRTRHSYSVRIFAVAYTPSIVIRTDFITFLIYAAWTFIFSYLRLPYSLYYLCFLSHTNSVQPPFTILDCTLSCCCTCTRLYGRPVPALGMM